MTSIETKGLTEAIYKLERLSLALQRVTQETLKRTAEEIVITSKQYAPVRTGYLRDHIGISSEEPNRIVITSEAPYSGFVEFGTVNSRAQPFMQPAAQDVAYRLIPTVFKSRLKDEINK